MFAFRGRDAMVIAQSDRHRRRNSASVWYKHSWTWDVKNGTWIRGAIGYNSWKKSSMIAWKMWRGQKCSIATCVGSGRGWWWRLGLDNWFCKSCACLNLSRSLYNCQKRALREFGRSHISLTFEDVPFASVSFGTCSKFLLSYSHRTETQTQLHRPMCTVSVRNYSTDFQWYTLIFLSRQPSQALRAICCPRRDPVIRQNLQEFC